MTPDEALSYFCRYNQHKASPGLHRIKRLLELMGSPQNNLKFIHVAGTNGKGSVCAFLDCCLRCAGIKTGLFTSPHIIRFNERIRVNGEEISGFDLAQIGEIVQKNAALLDEIPTQFELIVALAMEYFSRNACEIVVLETGLGGLLDATNVIASPILAVITNLGLEHTEI